MSTFKVTISIEVDGPITQDGHPKRLTFEDEYRTGDNPAWYGRELRCATREASEKVQAFVDDMYVQLVVDAKKAKS